MIVTTTRTIFHSQPYRTLDEQYTLVHYYNSCMQTDPHRYQTCSRLCHVGSDNPGHTVQYMMLMSEGLDMFWRIHFRILDRLAQLDT